MSYDDIFFNFLLHMHAWYSLVYYNGNALHKSNVRAPIQSNLLVQWSITRDSPYINWQLQIRITILFGLRHRLYCQTTICITTRVVSAPVEIENWIFPSLAHHILRTIWNVFVLLKILFKSLSYNQKHLRVTCILFENRIICYKHVWNFENDYWDEKYINTIRAKYILSKSIGRVRAQALLIPAPHCESMNFILIMNTKN